MTAGHARTHIHTAVGRRRLACYLTAGTDNDLITPTARAHACLQLGGKGANLCEMARIGLNVPPGMVITTDVCQQFYASGRRLPEGLMEEVRQVHEVMEL